MTLVQNLQLKIRLQNSLAKSKAALEEIKAEMEAQKAEIAYLKKILSDM
jgi:cell division protein FtsB